MALLAATLAVLRADMARVVYSPASLDRMVATQQPVALRGVIVDEPRPRERAQLLRLRVDALAFPDGEWRRTFGYAQITARLAPVFDYGDVLEVHGTIQTPEAGAPPGYATYLRHQGLDAIIGFPLIERLGAETPDRFQKALFALRRQMAAQIETLLPEPQASLVEGILLGRRATIPKELTEKFNQSGTSHMVAISGYNVSMVVGLVFAAVGGLAGRRSQQRWLPATLASGALWLFVALVGASGSVLRAAAMAQLALFGHAVGRNGAAGGLLIWGSAFLAAWQPRVLTDVGWQLSFLGTAGLIWLSPALAVRVPWLPRAVREALVATLAAQVFVLPVLAGAFGRVSLVAPLSNMLGLPLVPLVMLGGAVLVAAATIFPPAAPLAAALTWVPTTGLLRVVEWSAALPMATMSLPAWSAPAILAYLVGLVALCWRLEQCPQPGVAATGELPSPSTARNWLPNIALAGLAALACVAWAMTSPLASFKTTAELYVTVPSVASGSLALVRAPDGARLLLNGGPTSGSAVTLLGEQLRPWDRTVDVAVLTDPREVHLLGLTRVLERYRIGLLVDAVAAGGATGAGDHASGLDSSPLGGYPSAAYRQLRDVAQRRGLRRLQAEAGMEIAVGRNLTLEIIGPGSSLLSSPPSVTTTSDPVTTGHGTGQDTPMPPALRLRTGSFSLLMPGDAPAWRQPSRLSEMHPVQDTVLLLSERASREASTEAILSVATPALVVVQGAPRPGAALATGTQLRPPESGPTPAWHRTAIDGTLRLEVRHSGYHLLKQ